MGKNPQSAESTPVLARSGARPPIPDSHDAISGPYERTPALSGPASRRNRSDLRSPPQTPPMSAGALGRSRALASRSRPTTCLSRVHRGASATNGTAPLEFGMGRNRPGDGACLETDMSGGGPFSHGYEPGGSVLCARPRGPGGRRCAPTETGVVAHVGACDQMRSSHSASPARQSPYRHACGTITGFVQARFWPRLCVIHADLEAL